MCDIDKKLKKGIDTIKLDTRRQQERQDKFLV